MSNPLFLTLVLIGASCLYLFVVISGFRKSGKQQCSTFWLLLPLCGAAVIGLTLIFSIPALPATPLPSRLLELLAHLINILLIWTIVGKIAPINRLSGTLLYAWNPLVLIELTVYANTAGVVICLLLLAVYLSMQRFSGTRATARVPSSLPPYRRPYNDDESGSPAAFIVGAGVVEGMGGDPCGRPGASLAASLRVYIKRARERIQQKGRLIEIATLVLIGLAIRINFMALLIAPLLLWFMVRHLRDIAAALLGFAWRVLVVVAVFVVAYIPGWQGDATFLAITGAFHPFDFAYSPLSLLVMPTRALFSFVAQKGHFPPALMEPTQAADMTVLATSFFLFALLYLREMGRVRTRNAPSRPGEISSSNAEMMRNTSLRPVGTRGGMGRIWGPCACPRWITIRVGFRDPHRRASQQGEDKGTEFGTTMESQGDEDKHKAPALPHIHPLSLQDGDEGGGGTSSSLVRDKRAGFAQSYAYHTLFTSLTIVILEYIVLAVTVFGPGYVMWVVWIVALRRFDRLSTGALLLSCSVLLYYPLQRFAPTTTGIVLPLCIFGIPLVYGVVQRYIFVGRIERKNVLT